MHSAIRVYNATTEPQRAFECLAAAISVASGLFIFQSKMSVWAFKAAFLMSVLQCLMFAAKLNGDLELPPKTLPIGSFFFLVAWGIDRYITHVLKRNLQIVAEFEDLMRNSGDKASDADPPAESTSKGGASGDGGSVREGLRRRGGTEPAVEEETKPSNVEKSDNKKKQ